MNVCVYGASSNDIDQSYLQAGDLLGQLLAENDMDLVYGGGLTGMMGAVARGVLSAHGKVTGVAPKFFDVPGILRKEGCEFIFTDTMRQRKQKMEDLSQAFVMTAGGIGTYEEFFEILTLKQLNQNHAPLVILNTEGVYDDLLRLLENMVKKRFMDKNVLDLIAVAATPEEVISLLRAFR